MASEGGISLLLTQLRALAHKAAANALKKAGKSSLEQTVFKQVFKLIGERLTLNVVKNSVPVASALIGGFFDVGLMNRVFKLANVFYRKRFIVEKEARIKNCIDIKQLQPGKEVA